MPDTPADATPDIPGAVVVAPMPLAELTDEQRRDAAAWASLCLRTDIAFELCDGDRRVLGKVEIIDSRHSPKGVMSRRAATLELHTWQLPDSLEVSTVHAVVTTYTDQVAIDDPCEVVVVTEYDVTRPDVLAAVLAVVQLPALDPVSAELMWTAASSQPRLRAGMKDITDPATILEGYNGELRDGVVIWVNSVHALRQLDPRPLVVPIARTRSL